MRIEQDIDPLKTTRVVHDNRVALLWPGRKGDRDYWLYAPSVRDGFDILEPGVWCDDYLDALALATDYVTGCSQTTPPSSDYAPGSLAPAAHTAQSAASP